MPIAFYKAVKCSPVGWFDGVDAKAGWIVECSAFAIVMNFHLTFLFCSQLILKGTLQQVIMNIVVISNNSDAVDPPPAPRKYNFKKKKNQFGRQRKKNSKTRRDYDVAIQANPDNPASEDEVEVEVAAEPPSTNSSKRQRTDDNWRTNRHLLIKEGQREKEKQKRVAAETKLAEEKRKRVEDKARFKQDLTLEKKKRVGAEKKV